MNKDKLKEKSLNYIILSMLILLVVSLIGLISLVIVNIIINYGNLLASKMIFYRNLKKILTFITLIISLFNAFGLLLYMFKVFYSER